MIIKNNGLASLKVNRSAVKKTTLASVLCQVYENIPMVDHNLKATVPFL